MIKKKITLILLLIAGLTVVSLVTVMTLGWNVQTVNLPGGVSIAPAFGDGSLVLPSGNHLYIYDSGGDFRLLHRGERVKSGDTVYVAMELHNASNIPMLCRFTVDEDESNVQADYRFLFGEGEPVDDGSFKVAADGASTEWHYYSEALEPDEIYTVWLEITVKAKTNLKIIVGTPYFDMIQARVGAVSAEDGWKEIYEDDDEFFKF